MGTCEVADVSAPDHERHDGDLFGESFDGFDERPAVSHTLEVQRDGAGRPRD